MPVQPVPSDMPPEMAKLANDPKFKEALSALDKNEGNARGQAKRDAHGWLRARGVNVPSGATVSYKDQGE